MEQDNLGRSLRSWRDRLDPAEIGVTPGRLRRAPGVRREELAQLAGVSVDYLARLEQGRATHPSPSVLAPLARALRLSDEETGHLYRLAGQAPPGDGRINRHLTPGVQRIIDRLGDVPLLVIDPATTIVARNALAAALIGDEGEESGPHPHNHAWSTFTRRPGRVVVPEARRCALEVRVVSDLLAAAGEYPEDEGLHALIDDLHAVSPRFTELWGQRPVGGRHEDRKTFDHPEVGLITVDCDRLTVARSDLKIIVYTAPPGSPDAEALAFLGAIGTQRLTT